MDTHKFFVEKLRFHLNEPDMLVFVGWFYDGKGKFRLIWMAKSCRLPLQ